jgi:hypothetical protein
MGISQSEFRSSAIKELRRWLWVDVVACPTLCDIHSVHLKEAEADVKKITVKV